MRRMVAAMPNALGWRGLLLIGGVPALLVLGFRRSIPETPRFLEASSQPMVAERSLRWIARRLPSIRSDGRVGRDT